MYKSYQPTSPSSNRYLQKKWDDKHYCEHRILVRQARPSIDTRPPRTYMHLHKKLKKLQLEEERTATIERDNRILLEKMAQIMRTTGVVDHRNQYEAKSLNGDKRQRDLLAISKENAEMIKRIMAQKLERDKLSWKHGWAKHIVYLDNIAKYNSDCSYVKPRKTQTNNEVESSDVHGSRTDEGKPASASLFKTHKNKLLNVEANLKQE